VVAAETALLNSKSTEVARLEDASRRMPVELDAARAAEAAAKAQLDAQQSGGPAGGGQNGGRTAALSIVLY